MSQCKGCGKEIKFIKTPLNKFMPVDVEEITIGKDNKGLSLVRENGIVEHQPALGTHGYIPHWSTCPNAKEFKKSK